MEHSPDRYCFLLEKAIPELDLDNLTEKDRLSSAALLKYFRYLAKTQKWHTTETFTAAGAIKPLPYFHEAVSRKWRDV